ncbi:Transthyretin-like family protein [Ancylostoma caninum]|uniref:Transthyretin-like family protein n=1 Tax=Ancylostoma caninum TaxID=29170 RepID=A0A368G201_ANCCA|nr:Transthyretin-like family protein [Ancylostoma caninum]
MRQVLLLLAIVVCSCLALRQQSVGITGRLMCGDKPAAGVKVKLYDEDDGLDRDDLLDQGFTDARGEFTLKGSERETTNIDPVFKVYHDCDDGIKQSVGITGRLMCGDKPAAGVKVKLYDEDDGLDRDDLLDQGFTDARGEFTLKGSERETTNIDPVFKVYHDCDDGIKPGQRKVKFHIPNQYIYSGGVPRRLFNIGVLNLETIFPDEERDLI